MTAPRVIVLSPDELRAVVTDAVAAALGTRSNEAELVPLAAAGVPVRTLRAAIRVGALPASKAGRSYFIRRADLQAWLQAQRVSPRPMPKPEKSEAERAIERAQRSGALRAVRGAA